ncbi:nucleotidyltransferase domain-containing protein [Rheinheimera sp. YQF-2]|uniref:Nucleotidyltransferase domain-containing protein n=1 Tax=Rheinheimera lutimaris TaxID=2740584 RepID=A0A7Y5ART2_9GAMM|nr:nucleotidyltransferase domain-containing protein [Rheinheimera lutimaris]NRQ43347.1 nucleotidyltransferase domain-containing protein [Rheinheimera lutimaris]
MSALASLLFKEYRRQVLGLLLLQPDQAFHMREIARLTHTQPGTLHKELAKLADAGILKKTLQGNQTYYQADANCILFDELSSIMRKTSGLADVLRHALQPLTDKLQFAAVYGSVASGKATSASDIDVLLVGNAGYAEVVAALYPAQQELGREINPKLYSVNEWQDALNAQSGFIKHILASPMLPILGDTDDIRQPDREVVGAH